MRELEKYVLRKNRQISDANKRQPNFAYWRPLLELEKELDRQKIADMLDSELSPENLTMDGELSFEETEDRYNKLAKVADQLLELDPNVVFNEY